MIAKGLLLKGTPSTKQIVLQNVHQSKFAQATVCSNLILTQEKETCNIQNLFSLEKCMNSVWGHMCILVNYTLAIWTDTNRIYCQVMEDLLEEWCVSGGHPYDLDVTSLSVALEQARLKYHAQVRSTNKT